MSAPPESRTPTHGPAMNAQHHEPQQQQQQREQGKVRVVPIHVEGRDQPVINKSVDHSAHFGEAKSGNHPIDPEQYFADDNMHYQAPHHFARNMGGPHFRQPQGQPYAQKVFPNAYARGASPQRSQSPKTQHHDDYSRQVPVHHEQTKPRAQPQPQQQRQQPPPQQPPPQQHQQQHHQQQQQQSQTPPRQPTPPPARSATPADPITQILSIQTDVLNLMTEVENFKGTKKDKHYLYLDEMLTRNLIKLDNIETDGKDNIRTARKEAIKCIQKCISVLEAKAESNKAQQTEEQARDEEMNADQNEESNAENGEVDMKVEEKACENGEVEMKVPPKETKTDPASEQAKADPKAQNQADSVAQEQANSAPQVPDTRPENKPETDGKPETEKKNKKGPKNAAKKRDNSKDKKNSKAEQSHSEAMQVDVKGDKVDQPMDVDSVASQ